MKFVNQCRRYSHENRHDKSGRILKYSEANRHDKVRRILKYSN